MPFLSGTITVAPGGNFGNISGFTIPRIISWAITAVLVVAGVVFFFMLLIGGIQWIMSGGDKASTESARGKITAALVGLVIIFSAWAIIQLIQTVFGVSLTSLTIPSI